MSIIVLLDGSELKKSSLKPRKHFCQLDLREFLEMLLPKNNQIQLLSKNLTIYQIINIFNPTPQVISHAFLNFMTQVNQKLGISEDKPQVKYCFKFNGQRIQSLTDLSMDSKILLVSEKKEVQGLRNVVQFL